MSSPTIIEFYASRVNDFPDDSQDHRANRVHYYRTLMRLAKSEYKAEWKQFQKVHNANRPKSRSVLIAIYAILTTAASAGLAYVLTSGIL